MSLTLHLVNAKSNGILKPQPIRIFIILNHQGRKRFKTPLKIKPADWDFKKQRARTSYFDVVTFNQALNVIMNDCSNEVNQAAINHLTLNELHQRIKVAAMGIHKESSFYNTWDSFIDSRKGIKAKRTIQNYESTRDLLKRYSPMLTFEDIDMLFFDKFHSYMLNMKHQNGIGLRNDSAARYISNIKLFLKWSFERNMHTNTIYNHSSFVIKRRAVNEIVRLTKTELKQMMDVDLPKRLDRIRDVFLFGCFTGQRWKDVIGFRHQDVKNNCWVFEQNKGKKMVTIPLTGYAQQALPIIKKYKNWPVISGQKFNVYLKEVGQLAGVSDIVEIKRYKGSKEIVISKPKYQFMTSHMARRTFVSILINEGMPPSVIMKLTGHTSIKTLMKYINTNTDDVINALQKVSI